MTSVHHSSNQAASSVKALDKSRTSGKAGANPADASDEFSNLFGAMMEGMPGQNLAAPAVDTGQRATPATGLASEILGPSVHIITSTEPAISDDSLMAFARSQGLDEDALAMIFGRRGAPELQTLGSAMPTMDPSMAGSGASPSANDLLAAAVFSGKQAASALNAAMPAIDPAKDNALLAAQAAAMEGESLDLGPDARLSWRIGEANALGASNQAPAAGPLSSGLFGLNGIRAMPAPGEMAKLAAAEQAVHPEASNQSLAASLILGAAEASQFARRQQMKQVSQRSERFGEMLTNSNPTTGTAQSAQSSPSEVISEVLMLDTGLNDNELQQLMQQRQPEGRQPTGNPQPNPSAAEQAARSDLDMRAEQYDKLSQRLAEALGQRLSAQIARGDWKVEMALRPKDLGNIDIQLHMNRGELQASFSASQMATRDLIAEGLPKLREVLAQLGMEVASVDVNVRQESQHGGNPTPGKQSSGVAGVGSRRSVAESPAPSTLPPARSTAGSSDGLDVLV
ncbi:MAG: flagellar hook-length control protein FliK [Oxalobacteraceae bacterium]|nr:flagellar hook-length control protein FliK [Oxalobacteraceae bacterium]